MFVIDLFRVRPIPQPLGPKINVSRHVLMYPNVKLAPEVNPSWYASMSKKPPREFFSRCT